jgi:Family of unknown function (DUF6279)
MFSCLFYLNNCLIVDIATEQKPFTTNAPLIQCFLTKSSAKPMSKTSNMFKHERTNHRFLKCCAAIAAALCFVTACSLVGTLYQNATSLAMLEIDSYFDLNDAQTTAGKQRTDELMVWHRREALPLYVRQLRALAAKVESGFDVAAVNTTYDWGMGELRRVNQYAAPQQVELLTSLSDKQIAYLQKKLAKDNAKYRKEWVDATREDALELRFDKFLTNVERIYGNFSREQKQQLRAASDARAYNPKSAYEDRLARQSTFIAMMKKLPKNDAATAQAQIAAYISSLETPTENGLTTRRELMQLIATTNQIATPAQRTAAKATLLDYANTFEGLSRGR